ncbi:MAG TPA: uracil phosphoribosyltransferase [Persephonella sp.]|uniref:Uracil phosphoribosyltransferase n=1 Tax=Persephonella marina (strain DSM 14350 / EX-H1) TaxID=123214 RepID=C0QR39_PERMH|nr:MULTISPECIES: uracil phosphoribosyltransferase [Persephonella]ACO04346.1 uracil phosphoribosyltransferase [Persephonella marina EX-H1]HCB68886.1 uracil phosphoribosyltransferase [Persephonella sp.]
MENIINVKNPALTNIVTKLRDINTDSYLFRKYISEAGRILLLEALKDEKTVEKKVKIWVGEYRFPEIEEERYVFIPIMRAGLPMLDGVFEVLKNAKAGFLAIKRNEETLESVLYYDRVPPLEGKNAVILDPMVATGGSLDYAVKVIKKKNPEKIISLNIIGAPEGLKRIAEKHPEIKVYIAQIDERLNDKGYIIPGIGDAGDRAFNTE